jgi:hypothetical protein
MIIQGLKYARARFTELVDAARDGNESIFVEKGNSRQLNVGYKLVKMTPAELAEAVKKHPELNIPKPGLPQPKVLI